MANTNLNAFLNPVTVENKEVIVSKRFLDEKGNPVPFVIRPISHRENEMLMRKHRKRDSKGEYVRHDLYVAEMVATAVVSPDLNDERLQKQYGLGKEKCLSNMLFTGEYSQLAEEVMKLSGLDEDFNDMIDDVKNV